MFHSPVRLTTHDGYQWRYAGTGDTAVNAVVLLDLLAKAIPFPVGESLESLRPLFTAAHRA